MKRCILLFLVLCLIVTPIIAADGTIVITYDKAKPGKYILQVQVDESGVAKVSPVNPDYNLNGPVPPGPSPTPDLTERALEIKKAADIVQGDPERAQTAQELAAVYREIANKVRSGEVTGQTNIALAAKYGADFLLNPKGSTVATGWKSVREVLNSQWIKLVQEGGSDADFAKLLDEAAVGLQASSGISDPQLDMNMIIKIIEMVLEILKLIS